MNHEWPGEDPEDETRADDLDGDEQHIRSRCLPRRRPRQRRAAYPVAARKAAEMYAANPDFLFDAGEADFLATTLIDAAVERPVWEYRIPETRHALLPPGTSRPNPILLNGLAIASTFSPGRIAAVDQATGEERWLLTLPYYGDRVYAASGLLFSSTSEALMRLDPADGRVCWEFRPQMRSRETLYSLPVYADGRVYIGDRAGWFHCLDADNGKPLWSTRTSIETNCGVNATAVIVDDLVITATNAKLVVAYDRLTGSEVWHHPLPGPSTSEVRRYGAMVLVETVEAVIGFDPRTGAVLHRWEWPGWEICFVTTADDILCVVVTNEYRLRPEWQPTPDPKLELVGLRGDSVIWRRPYYRYAATSLRYEPANGLVYEATASGLGVLAPKTGRRLAVYRHFEDDEHEMPLNLTGLPSVDVDGGSLYLLTERGLLARFRYNSY